MAARRPVAPPAFAGSRADEPERATLLGAPVHWPDPARLEAPLSSLTGIGPALEKKAAAAGVHRVGDLLWRLPKAVGDPPETRLLAEIEPGENGIIAVEVERARRVRTRRGRPAVVEARISDSSGRVRATWFNQPWIIDRLRPGARFLLEGRRGPKGFTVAATEPLEGSGEAAVPGGIVDWNHREAATPAELSGDGMRVRRPGGGEVGPGRWRSWTFAACRLAGFGGDPVPSHLLRGRSMPGATAALREIHFPEDETRAGLALRRLAWEELLLYRAMLENRRSRERAAAGPAPVLDGSDRITAAWLKGLPFRLTGDQQQAVRTIRGELAAGDPMRRLLMGEVGSGKTVVALAAVVRAAESGFQSALMAPTAVLAEQHAATVTRLLEGTGLTVGLLTGATGKAERRRLLRAAADGSLDLLVGTHALLEPDLGFSRLALCVVDEEHRFGVRQRGRLESKAPAGTAAHLLHMSATPIPRTLSLTAYGDLDVTALRELPADRLPVRTELVRESDRPAVFARIRDELDRGRQCFVVCPLVEESEELEARAAEAEAIRLAEGELAGYEVGLIHGRMNAAKKEVAMAAFADGRTRALVATTVIEVGIDVPNATMMVIEGAERFGLSQLHQLRGRIGRGKHGGTCFLLPAGGGGQARRRLAEVAREIDGFRLAELDLEMRGEGEIAGTRQHGIPRFRAASLPRDTDLLELACADLKTLGAGPERDLLVRAGRRRFETSGRAEGPAGEDAAR